MYQVLRWLTKVAYMYAATAVIFVAVTFFIKPQEVVVGDLHFPLYALLLVISAAVATPFLWLDDALAKPKV